jgi:hypothetical protein
VLPCHAAEVESQRRNLGSLALLCSLVALVLIVAPAHSIWVLPESSGAMALVVRRGP